MNKILIIVEGDRDETTYLEQFLDFRKALLSGRSTGEIVVQSYGTLIYDLYKRLIKRGIEEFETIPLLVEILEERQHDVSEELRNVEQFSDIYLLFDLDAHYFVKREDREEAMYVAIDELLTVFNESTEKGKLLLSYPMFEALKCFDDSFINTNDRKAVLHVFNIYEVKQGKSSTSFKNLCRNIGAVDSIYHQPTYHFEKIVQLINYCLVSLWYLIKTEDKTEDKIYDSKVIFQNQVSAFIEKNHNVLLLSSFPHFIIDFFGLNKIDEMVDKDLITFDDIKHFDYEIINCSEI